MEITQETASYWKAITWRKKIAQESSDTVQSQVTSERFCVLSTFYATTNSLRKSTGRTDR